MMYPLLTLDDGTEIVYSGKRNDNTVKVYVEKADAERGFRSAVCILPEYKWQDICGFTDAEISRFEAAIRAAGAQQKNDREELRREVGSVP